MNEVELKAQQDLALSIIEAVKSRLYDIKEFTIKNIEVEPRFLSKQSREYLVLDLPNGETLGLNIYRNRVTQ